MIFEDVFTTVSFIVLFLVVLTFVIAIVIQINRNKKIHRSDTPEKSIKTDLNYEFTTTEMNATVVDMMCNTRVVGQKSVKSVEEFFLCFKTESNDIIKLKVLKEMYDGFEIGQTGKLRLVDGELFGFEIF